MTRRLKLMVMQCQRQNKLSNDVWQHKSASGWISTANRLIVQNLNRGVRFTKNKIHLDRYLFSKRKTSMRDHTDQWTLVFKGQFDLEELPMQHLNHKHLRSRLLHPLRGIVMNREKFYYACSCDGFSNCVDLNDHDQRFVMGIANFETTVQQIIIIGSGSRT